MFVSLLKNLITEHANAPLSAMIQLKAFNYKKCPSFQMKEKAGPALMTTVAMPVFSTKNETVSD